MCCCFSKCKFEYSLFSEGSDCSLNAFESLDFFEAFLDKIEPDKNDSGFILDFSTIPTFFILLNSDVYVQDRYVDMSIRPSCHFFLSILLFIQFL